MKRKISRPRPVFAELPDLRQLSCRELLIKFYHLNEPNKLAYLRQLAENFRAGKCQGQKCQKQETVAVEDFLRSFITANHPLHETHLVYLLSYGWSMYFDRQKAIRDAQLITYCFLKCSSISAETQKVLEVMEKNPPDRKFLEDAALAIKYSKLERPTATTG